MEDKLYELSDQIKKNYKHSSISYDPVKDYLNKAIQDPIETLKLFPSARSYLDPFIVKDYYDNK
jgi:hypothetical protein